MGQKLNRTSDGFTLTSQPKKFSSYLNDSTTRSYHKNQMVRLNFWSWNSDVNLGRGSILGRNVGVNIEMAACQRCSITRNLGTVWLDATKTAEIMIELAGLPGCARTSRQESPPFKYWSCNGSACSAALFLNFFEMTFNTFKLDARKICKASKTMHQFHLARYLRFLQITVPKASPFWVLTPSVVRYQRFAGIYCLHFPG